MTGVSFILTRQNTKISKTATHNYSFFLSPSTKASFHHITAKKSDKVNTLSLSGCLTRLGFHPTASQTESLILSNLSCPASFSSSWSHTQTNLTYQAPLLLLSPASSSATTSSRVPSVIKISGRAQVFKL